MAYQFGAPYTGYQPGQTYFPQQPQYQQPQQQMPAAFACHPVGSREEAIAAQTDYFSAGLVMPDLSHGAIYLKRFNQQTGASDFFEFRMEQPETKKTPSAPEFVTREEFDRLYKIVMKGELTDE